MIGFGHIAWRLRELLAPFEATVLAYDPYAPRELADALRIDFTTLDTVMGCDVVICLAPATPATTGMVGARELALLPRDAVFVNVSRAVVVDLDALVAKAKLEDAWFCIDVHDPGADRGRLTTDRAAQCLLVPAHRGQHSRVAAEVLRAHGRGGGAILRAGWSRGRRSPIGWWQVGAALTHRCQTRGRLIGPRRRPVVGISNMAEMLTNCSERPRR